MLSRHGGASSVRLLRFHLLPERLQVVVVRRLAEHSVEGLGQLQQTDLQVEARPEGVHGLAGVSVAVAVGVAFAAVLVRRTLRQVALLHRHTHRGEWR